MTGAQEATGTPRAETPEPGLPEAAPDGTPDALATPPPAASPASAVDATPFAHASEAEMARILDFYQVRWEYEPTTFPILWNLDGDVIESFAPDFYLPDLEVFLEMTTLKQRLVRKKNRKLRRLRELYPDIRIKLFYARDFRAMMLKYGRLGLAASLSGTTGQVVPERAAPEGVAGPGMGPSPEPVSDLGQAASQESMKSMEPMPIPRDEGSAGVADLPIAAVPRATPRPRSARRRRRAALPTKAGAEREAGG